MAPELKRARLGVIVAFVVNGFTAGTFVARIPDIKQILAITDSVLGLSLLFVSIGVFAGLGPAGRNSARYGSRPVIIWGTLAIVISLPVVGWLPSLGVAWFGLFIFGFALATQDVSMNAHAVVIEQRAGRRLMSTFHAMYSVGTLFGGILGGIFSQLSVTPLNQGFILAFVYLLALFFIRNLILPASVDA